MKKPPVIRPSTNARLADSLNKVLADSCALLSLTHLAHWNVEGPGFFALHAAFQTQYEKLFVAIDGIAERARDVAGEAGDAESQDLMIGRNTLHQKTIWMLKSFLKA